MSEKRGVALLASVLLLGVLVLMPAVIGWFYDFVSSLTHQITVKQLSDADLLGISLGWYNSTAEAVQWEPQSYTYDPDAGTIIIPSVAQSGSTDQPIMLEIRVNHTSITGKWLWDDRIEHIVIAVAVSTNITVSNVKLTAYDDAGNGHAKTYELNKTGDSLTLDLSLSYTTGAWFSQYDGHRADGTGLRFELVITDPLDLNTQYMELSVIFTRSEKSWITGLADYMLGMAGIGLLVAGLFATPFVSLRQIRELFRPRRR